MQRQKPDLVIYHGGCTDGFTAAWAIWKIFGDKIEYFAGKYDRENLILPETAGKHVYLVDFSYPKAILEQIAAEAASVTILDHHKTAQADIQPLLDNKTVGGEFDMERSGAGMAWDWFHQRSNRPEIINYVEDRDLWAWKLPDSRKISSWLSSWPIGDFNEWDQVATRLEHGNRAEIITEGEALDRKMKLDCERLAGNAQWVEIGGVSAPLVNANVMFCSDLANLLARIPEAPFGATYFVDSDGVKCFSLRSLPEKMDVSAIAKIYGGGGHRNASGFGLSRGKSL
jgi:hypothetical protein